MAERLTGMRRTPVRADPRQSRGHGLTEGLPGDRRVLKGWVPCARMAGLK